MLRNDWPVIADDRYGGDKQCFYCEAPVGSQHRAGCVQRRRTVVVRFSVEMVIDEPEDHDRDLIEFGYNEGSWCADNFTDMLDTMQKRLDAAGGCLCPHLSAEFVREATKEDEAEHHISPPPPASS